MMNMESAWRVQQKKYYVEGHTQFSWQMMKNAINPVFIRILYLYQNWRFCHLFWALCQCNCWHIILEFWRILQWISQSRWRKWWQLMDDLKKNWCKIRADFLCKYHLMLVVPFGAFSSTFLFLGVVGWGEHLPLVILRVSWCWHNNIKESHRRVRRVFTPRNTQGILMLT